MQTSAKQKVQKEFLVVFTQPLTDSVVRQLLKINANPLFIVLTNSIFGFLAAYLLASHGNGFLIFISLQLKTLFDNADGGLARAKPQLTQMGRYFDTGMDFIVNFFLFIALSFYGPWYLSFLAFITLMLILSLNFNLEYLYRFERNLLKPANEHPIGAPLFLFNIFKGLYENILLPQDKLLAKLERRRIERLNKQQYADISTANKRKWSDHFSTASLVNLGLSSQMLVLGLCALIGKPFFYVYIIFIEFFYVVAIQLYREHKYKKFLSYGEHLA